MKRSMSVNMSDGVQVLLGNGDSGQIGRLQREGSRYIWKCRIHPL